MKRFSFSMLLFLCVFVFTCFSSFAQDPPDTQFRLSGKHSFESSGAENWTVSQELIDEQSGESQVSNDFAKAKGAKAKFDLAKVDKKETIYRLKAEGKGSVKEFTVRVFEPNKISSFLYKTELNPPVRAYIYVPKSLSAKTRFIMVMHGLSRNADDYIASWEKWAGKNDYIAVAPLFDAKNWKGAAKYNNGNIITSDGLKVRQKKWSFQLVDDLHSLVSKGFGLDNDYYDLFGHSAGGQFVHRFMLFLPKAKVRVALAANPGWYTLPDLEQEFPYGLKHEKLSFTNADLLNWTKRNVMILRGTDDILRTDNLQKTPEADAQGQNRFERAAFMYDKIKTLDPGTNWRLIEAPKVGHDQTRMAIAAQYVLDMLNPKK
ncbi:MAG: hypothetical protein R2681_09145 [Pyrinomonadaceae bacterium]